MRKCTTPRGPAVRIEVMLLLAAGLFCVTISAGAQTAPKTESDTPSTAAEQPVPVKPKPVDLLDRELLKDLVPELPLDEPADERQSIVMTTDELDHAVQSMRDVTERLDRKDVSEETSRLQTSVLDDIDALIERLKNRPPPQDSSSSPEQSNQDQQNQNRDQGSRSQNQEPKPGQAADQPKAGTDSSTQSQAQKSEESSEQNPRKAQERAAALARRRALINEVWGHLPPSVRERLLNVQSEKLLPGYEALIRRYYESLAETREDK